MSIIMPTIAKFVIYKPDQKTVVSEHGPGEIDKCRKLIEGTDNIIQYVFKELEEEENATVS